MSKDRFGDSTGRRAVFQSVGFDFDWTAGNTLDGPAEDENRDRDAGRDRIGQNKTRQERIGQDTPTPSVRVEGEMGGYVGWGNRVYSLELEQYTTVRIKPNWITVLVLVVG